MKVYLYDFMPYNGNEADLITFTITELNCFLLQEGCRVIETQKIIFAAIHQQIHIKDIGTFRRIS